MQAIQSSGGDLNSLRRKTPDNAGARRVWVSRAFDREFLRSGHSGNHLEIVGLKADQLIKAGWASPLQRAGWKQVRREVICALQRFTRELGLEIDPALFNLSQRRIRDARYYRIVDVRAHDRKSYDDERPRIRRRNDLLRPMQQLVMDVKVIDCAVARANGSVAWPRMVAFMDTGTHRVFCRFFLLKPGEGIRQEHVVSAFLDLVSDLQWGFPEQIYRDNGSEFQILDKIRTPLEQLQSDKVRTIVNARPYAAASKPIESKFAVLDRFVFSQMAGWAGGDRMRLKTHHLGQPPRPFEGLFQDFVDEANERLTVFETQTIDSGPFFGKSPRQIFLDHVANGWRPVLVSTDRLDAAFCSRETRRVSRGCLKLGGHRYRHPHLINGQTVTVALPWRRGAVPLALLRGAGWTCLARDEPYPPTLRDGPRESQLRARQHDELTRALAREAGLIDLEANRRDRLAALDQVPCTSALVDADMLPEEISLAAALPRSRADKHPAGASASAARKLKTMKLEQFLANPRR